jgi:hypothetical protein
LNDNPLRQNLWPALDVHVRSIRERLAELSLYWTSTGKGAEFSQRPNNQIAKDRSRRGDSAGGTSVAPASIINTCPLKMYRAVSRWPAKKKCTYERSRAGSGFCSSRLSGIERYERALPAGANLFKNCSTLDWGASCVGGCLTAVLNFCRPPTLRQARRRLRWLADG